MPVLAKAKLPNPTPVLEALDGYEVETRMGSGTVRCLARDNNPSAHFSLHDEFDIYNNNRLFEALEQGVGHRNVTIDLAHTTFIDASILGIFVRLAGRCRKNNGAKVRIINASRQLRRLFSICRLEGFFGIAGPSEASDEPVAH